MLECPDCEIPVHRGKCQRCGWKPSTESKGSAGASAKRTPTHCMCGSPLTSLAQCRDTGLWPRMWITLDDRGDPLFAPVPCPFFCPLCRGRLDWQGGCDRCHGTSSGKREDWAFPGDRYQRHVVHWELEAKGPRPACSPEYNKQKIQEVMAILGKSPLMQPVPAVVVDENAGW